MYYRQYKKCKPVIEVKTAINSQARKYVRELEDGTVFDFSFQ